MSFKVRLLDRVTEITLPADSTVADLRKATKTKGPDYASIFVKGQSAALSDNEMLVSGAEYEVVPKDFKQGR